MKKPEISANTEETNKGLHPIHPPRMLHPIAQYGFDILGAFLLMLAVITLFGMFQLSTGTLLDAWVNALARIFGFGRFFVLAGMVLLGVNTLMATIRPAQSIRLSAILQIEAAILCLLPLLSILNGHSIETAMEGQNGGIVGWGLADLLLLILPPILAGLLLIGLMFFFFLSGSGILQWIARQLDRWSKNTLRQSAFTQPDLWETAIDSVDLPQAVIEDGTDTEVTAILGTQVQRADASRPSNLPPMDLLLPDSAFESDEEHIRQTAALIEKTLAEFQIPARVVGYRVGPTVTQFAVEPGFTEITRPDGGIQRKKVRISQISGLSRDLARALSAERLRIEAPVTGHSFVGIEVANPKSAIVRLRALLESKDFKKIVGKPLALTLGRDVSGDSVIADLASMPHLLIAGTTGSGKSVCLEALTTCLIMNNSPAELRLAMLDPKMVELVRFNGLPHLLGSVETDLERMLTVLRWALVEMENRYRLLESVHTRDLETFNKKMKKQGKPGLPSIVIMIDELADLMMIAPEQTEHSLTRLAQKARATGIHLVVATQRPSTDVVTGMIKANFPARIAFQVATGIDSRVIIDTQGAEELLGNGDMLYVDPSVRAPVRAQGVLISDNEIENVIEYWQREFNQQKPAEGEIAPWEPMIENNEEDSDDLFDAAVETVRKTGRANASWLQRSLRIGYPRAASLIDQMEVEGIIGPSRGGGRDREILINREDSDTEYLADEHRAADEEDE